MSIAHFIAIVILLSFQIGFLAVQDAFLDEVFPNTPTTSKPPDNRYLAAKRQRTSEFFGLDSTAGTFGIFQKFGRPERARIYKSSDYTAPPYPDPTRLVEYRVYGYPGMEITFREGLLLLIDITGEQWRFPIGIKIGDPERTAYDRFGQPGWRYEYSGQRQLDWDFTGRLSVYIRGGKVSRIVWG